MWTKLVLGNDWGHLYYRKASYRSSTGTYSRNSDGVKIPKKKVRVQWPDGHESIERVCYKSYANMVSDMGHSYNASGKYEIIRAEVHGVEVEVPLHKVKIWLED